MIDRHILYISMLDMFLIVSLLKMQAATYKNGHSYVSITQPDKRDQHLLCGVWIASPTKINAPFLPCRWM